MEFEREEDKLLGIESMINDRFKIAETSYKTLYNNTSICSRGKPFLCAETVLWLRLRQITLIDCLHLYLFN